jgi:hypothetical protein
MHYAASDDRHGGYSSAASSSSSSSTSSIGPLAHALQLSLLCYTKRTFDSY